MLLWFMRSSISVDIYRAIINHAISAGIDHAISVDTGRARIDHTVIDRTIHVDIRPGVYSPNFLLIFFSHLEKPSK